MPPSLGGCEFCQGAGSKQSTDTATRQQTAEHAPTGDQSCPAPTLVHHLHTSPSGSTLYHKETRDGVCFEKHVQVFNRCLRKDKQRLKEKQRNPFREETKETLPQKRQRLEKAWSTSFHVVPSSPVPVPSSSTPIQSVSVPGSVDTVYP